MSDKAPILSPPLRRMTQAELDKFLEKAADILRGNVDHSEFRGYVFALLFFKRISDVFEESVRNLAKKVGDDLANDPALQKKSLPFVVPLDCAWEAVTVGTTEKKVTSLQLGQSLNDAMLAIERANAPKFDGILTSKIDFNKTDEIYSSHATVRMLGAEQLLDAISDVTAVPAMGVIAEAMAAFVLADAVLEKFGGDSLGELLRNVDAYLARLDERVG